MPATLKHPKWPALLDSLRSMGAVTVAVSGSVDSLLLATLAHRTLPGRTLMAHAVSPAVPPECTARVRTEAQAQGWRLTLVDSGEFSDERYLQNPSDRCYFCKQHLYRCLGMLSRELSDWFKTTPVIISATDTNHLVGQRPGLEAAREHGVRHPFVEAGISKGDIRAIAGELGLWFAQIPASPCLASRIDTGTRVTPEVLAAVNFAETFLRDRLNVQMVRCRIRNRDMLVEMQEKQRPLADAQTLAELALQLRAQFPAVGGVALDQEGAVSGRAFTRQTL